MKPVPQGKISRDISSAFKGAQNFMRMPTHQIATLFTGLNAVEAGEETRCVIADVATAYAHQMISFRDATQCINRLSELWTGLAKK